MAKPAAALTIAPVVMPEYAQAHATARARAALALSGSALAAAAPIAATAAIGGDDTGSARAYATAKMHALSNHRAMVVFVKTPLRQIPNAECCRWDDYGTIDPSIAGAAVVVGIPESGEMFQVAVMPASTPDDAIAAWTTLSRSQGLAAAAPPAAARQAEVWAAPPKYAGGANSPAWWVSAAPAGYVCDGNGCHPAGVAYSGRRR